MAAYFLSTLSQFGDDGGAFPFLSGGGRIVSFLSFSISYLTRLGEKMGGWPTSVMALGILCIWFSGVFFFCFSLQGATKFSCKTLAMNYGRDKKGRGGPRMCREMGFPRLGRGRRCLLSFLFSVLSGHAITSRPVFFCPFLGQEKRRRRVRAKIRFSRSGTQWGGWLGGGIHARFGSK